MEATNLQLWAISAILLTVLLKWIVSYLLKIRDLPPGPWGLPILGYTPWLGEKPHEAFMEIAKKYGGVFSFGFGPQSAVVLNDYESIKEALVDKGKIFSGRPHLKTCDMISDRKDVAFSHGPIWKKQRNLVIHCLRNVGMGKQAMETKGMDLVHEIINHIELKRHEDVYMDTLFFSPIMKIFWHIITGERTEENKNQLKEFEEIINDLFEIVRSNNPVNLMSWLRFCPPNGFGYWKTLRYLHQLKPYLKSLVDEHMDRWNSNSLCDFIDYYISQIKQNPTLEAPYNSEYLKFSVQNMFAAGVDTINTTCLWGMLYLALHPEVQKKAQNELDKVVGSQRFLCMSDMPHLPYLEATVMEIHRKGSVIPLSLVHMSLETTTLGGYTIPKETTCFQNIYGVHHDPRLWDNPDMFDPQRFIDINNKVTVPPYLMPFSLGVRSCVGQQLAEVELRLIFGGLLQRYEFSLPQNHPTPNVTDTINTISLRPKPYYLCITPRS